MPQAQQQAAGGDAERRELPLQTRDATVGNVDLEARTVELVWSTGAGVTRRDWWTGERYIEELSLDPAHVDMTRLNNGAPLLNSHWYYSLEGQIGVVESAELISLNEARAVVRFSRREDVEPLFRDVQDKIIRNVSVGYNVRTFEITKTDGAMPTWRAVDWEPVEISLVTVPADAGAGVRSLIESGKAPAGAQRLFPCNFITRSLAGVSSADATQESVMPQTETPAASTAASTTESTADQVRAAEDKASRAERTRGNEIRNIARLANLGEDFAQRHIDEGTSLEEVRKLGYEELSKRASQNTPASTGRVETLRDETETRRAAMTEAMLHRMDSRVQLDAGRQFRGMSLLRLAEECLSVQGINVRGMARMDIAARALQTNSDFAFVASNVANRRLRDAYTQAVGTYQMWARRAPNAPDFKEIQIGQLSAAPDLDRVNEQGEFKYGVLSDGSEKYNVITYGVIVGFTRQLIVNDDLRSFDDLLTKFARSAARKENRLVYGQLTGNPKMGDGTTLFHADHKNLGAAGAIDADSLGTARTAMRLQKGLQKEELNIAPRFLLVPATLEQKAYQFTSSQFVPAKATDTNEFRSGGRTALEPIVDPVLDADSTKSWYLASDAADCDTIEYCWLDGSEGAYIESQAGFDIDGIKFKCRLDFGTKAVDWRGLFKNPGA